MSDQSPNLRQCFECGGSGVVTAFLESSDALVRYACDFCDGSGIEASA